MILSKTLKSILCLLGLHITKWSDNFKDVELYTDDTYDYTQRYQVGVCQNCYAARRRKYKKFFDVSRNGKKIWEY